MKQLLAILTLLSLPLVSLAAGPTPGTNEYLKSVGYTDDQLNQKVATEQREAFPIAEGAVAVQDPVGDVLDRVGDTSPVHDPWGDVTSASLTKDESAGNWVFTTTVAGTIPPTPTDKINFLFYVDGDGDKTNNETQGVRADTDMEYTIRYGATDAQGTVAWNLAFRWYNGAADAKTWATNKTTAGTFDIKDGTVTLRIPFSEISKDVTPRWRMAAALASGSDTEVDVAPAVGFPPPQGQTYPDPKFDPFASAAPSAPMAIPTDAYVLYALVGVAAIILGWSLARLRKP